MMIAPSFTVEWLIYTTGSQAVLVMQVQDRRARFGRRSIAKDVKADLVFFMLFPVCQSQENTDKEEAPLFAVPAIQKQSKALNKVLATLLMRLTGWRCASGTGDLRFDRVNTSQ
jgi:hypothetical protein